MRPTSQRPQPRPVRVVDGQVIRALPPYGTRVEDHPIRVVDGQVIRLRAAQRDKHVTQAQRDAEFTLALIKNNGGPWAKDCLLIAMAQGEAMANIPDDQRFFKGEFRQIREEMIKVFEAETIYRQNALAATLIESLSNDMHVPLSPQMRQQVFHNIRTRTLTAELAGKFILSRGHRLYNLVVFTEVYEGERAGTFTPTTVTYPLHADKPFVFITADVHGHHFEAVVPDKKVARFLVDLELAVDLSAIADPEIEQAMQASMETYRRQQAPAAPRQRAASDLCDSFEFPEGRNMTDQELSECKAYVKELRASIRENEKKTARIEEERDQLMTQLQLLKDDRAARDLQAKFDADFQRERPDARIAGRFAARR